MYPNRKQTRPDNREGVKLRIEKDYLTINPYSRPGRKLSGLLGVVMHWTANPRADAKANRNYFEARKDGRNGYGSAHYIVGTDGGIIQAIPENEVAYHCGSSQPDPASGKLYTDEARGRFGPYASGNNSPNNCTIGIELCPTDSAGNFSDATIEAAAELCADICRRYALPVNVITTHHNVVGWKNCPKLWTERPYLFEAFKMSVADKIQRG